MEELLNKLIERGWKPRGKNYGVVDFLGTLVFVDLNDGRLQSKNALDLRKLVSKESGLWQFVCEYVLIDIDDIYTRDFIDEGRDYIAETYSSNTDYEYWVLRSALCDEDKLEQFLLDNIKIECLNEN